MSGDRMRQPVPKDSSLHVPRPADFTTWLRNKVVHDDLNERHEREADRLAEQMDRPGAAAPAPNVPRRRTLQTPPIVAAHPGLRTFVRASLGSEGEPLDGVTRGFFETRLGYDLSSVRIHTGAAAARSAHAIDAQAYTVGQDIVFGEGRFAPGTRAGWRLMAHELIHVTQPQPGVRVRRKPKPGPKFDPKTMTDAEKAQLREAINKEATALTTEVLRKVDAHDLTAAESQQITTWRNQVAASLKKVNAMPKGDQRDVRRQLLEAVAKTLNDKQGAKVLVLLSPINSSTIAIMGNPKPVKPEQLDSWRAETRLIGGGGRGLVMSKAVLEGFQNRKLKPEDLQTGEETSAEADVRQTGTAQTVSGSAPPDPTAPVRTLEDRLLLEDLFGALPDAADSPVGDEPQLLEQYRKLTPDQRDKFKQYLQATHEPGADPKPLSDALKSFMSMSPADKEVMELNKRLGEKDEAGEKGRLEGPVLVKLQKDAGQFKEYKKQFKQLHANLARMKKNLQGPAPSTPDLGIEVFVNEMAMAGGLMLGAAEASPLVRQVVDVLMTELATAREKILKDLAEDLAISAALALLPVVGEVELARVAQLIKKYYDKFQALAKVYATAEKIAAFIDTVKNLPDTYRRFVDTYHRVVAKLEAAQALLADLDSAEDVEAKLEEAEQKLMDEFEALLEGKFGDLLERMYIPADTSADDLVELIFGIPKGIEALGRMWEYYQSPDAKSDYAEEILMIRGFEAGKRLYPFVGWLVAHIADALDALLSRGAAKRLAARLMPSSQRTGGKERGRRIFRRRNRKHLDIKPEALAGPLSDGEKRMRDMMNVDEPSKHWAPAWFRFALRQDVKKLNAQTVRDKKTVRAEVKETVGSGRSKSTKKTTEQVPLPKFRLRFHRLGRTDKQIRATLHLNPAVDLKADVLSNDDLDLDKGEPYKGTPEKRQAALRDWLGDAGYQLTHDNAKAIYIRLPGGKYETPTRSYLRFNSAGAIVRWKPQRGNNDWEAFKGRIVSTSADLPEGYLLIGDTHGTDADKDDQKSKSAVQRKRGMATILWQLGLDASQHLVKGPGEKQPEFLWPAKVTTTRENYDSAAMLKHVFQTPNDYNLLDHKDQTWWAQRIKKDPKLQQRPRRLEGTLGYTVRARLAGDKLSSMYVPQLRVRDDKGHLVARRFDGADDYMNLVPMKRSLNQVGGWYQLEQRMAESYIGKKKQPNEYVKFRLDLQYPNGETRRPKLFAISWIRRVAAKPQQPADNDKVLDKKAVSDVFDND